MDGTYALSHQDVGTRQYGDEFACIGVQFETRDGDPGSPTVDGGDPGLKRPFGG